MEQLAPRRQTARPSSSCKAAWPSKASAAGLVGQQAERVAQTAEAFVRRAPLHRHRRQPAGRGGPAEWSLAQFPGVAPSVAHKTLLALLRGLAVVLYCLYDCRWRGSQAVWALRPVAGCAGAGMTLSFFVSDLARLAWAQLQQFFMHRARYVLALESPPPSPFHGADQAFDHGGRHLGNSRGGSRKMVVMSGCRSGSHSAWCARIRNRWRWMPRTM